MHSMTPPGRSTRAHSRSTAAGEPTYSRTLAATTASKLADANGSVRQPGCSRHPLDRAGGIGRRRLVQHVRRDVAAGHLQPGGGQMPGQFPAAAAEVQHASPAGTWHPAASASCASRPVSRPCGAYLAGPAARLDVEQPAAPPQCGPAPGQS